MPVYRYHVVEVAQRNRVQGYRLVRTFVRKEAMSRWVEKQGKPVWIITNQFATLPHGSTFGDIQATRWNSGSGPVVDTMPVLPFHEGK